MPHLDLLLEAFEARRDAEAIIRGDRPHTYGMLMDGVACWRRRLDESGVEPGAVVSVRADFSPGAVALFLALVERSAVIVPLSQAVAGRGEERERVAGVEVAIDLGADDEATIERRAGAARHEHYATLGARRHPGLVLFSSGTTGESKAAVHDLVPLLEKFKAQRRRLRTIAFLLFDHIGGINTMLHTLANGGCLVTVGERSPDAVLAAVARHRAELLPASPTFLNLALISGAHERHDLSSLRLVTYGTEPMPASTLARLGAALPGVELQQTYGLSEVGILRSRSRSSDSLWVRLGGEGFETRVVDGLLEVRARSAMLGYLNAPSPFTDDGWLRTGDRVEVDGEYLRILGRRSDLINVGGEKVHPAEVESVIQELENIADVEAYGEPNALVGSVVCARVRLVSPEDPKALRLRVTRHCAARLARYKVPVKVSVESEALHGARFKKRRTPGGGA